MPLIYQTLVFTDEREQNLGRYVHIIDALSIGGADSPSLMRDTANMKSIKELYQKIDFTGIKLIKIQLKEL